MRIHDRFEISADGVKVCDVWHTLGQFGEKSAGLGREACVKSAIDLLVDLLAKSSNLCGRLSEVVYEVFGDAGVIRDQFDQIDLETDLSDVSLLSPQLQDDVVPVTLRQEVLE